MKKSDKTYEEIRALCIQMCRKESRRLRIVKNEEDETTNLQPEAQEFLKLDEKRCGRDFKLYGLMATVHDNIGFALADFAEIIMVIKQELPNVFESVRGIVNGWDRFFDAEKRGDWRELWLD